MARYTFQAALGAAQFPLVTKFQERSVVIDGLDNTLMKAGTTAFERAENNNPKNLPQVLYCENVVPTEQGCTTVGYVDHCSTGPTADFDKVFVIVGDDGSAIEFAPCRGKNYYRLVFGPPGWTSFGSIFPTDVEVSVADVNGDTYILYAGTKLYKYSGGIFTDVSGALVGVAVNQINAICGSGSYLIAQSGVDTYWSTVTAPLNFQDLTLGAGVQIASDLKGPGFYLTSTQGGFFIHGRLNTVAALYTSNANTPWTFREVKNAGGAIKSEFITSDAATGNIFMYGSGGLQQLDLRKAEDLFADVTDFLAGRVIETFDPTSLVFTQTRLNGNYLDMKLAFISSRYLVISYGTAPGVMNYAIVWDTNLKRWGKLKIDHVDCFGGYIINNGDIRESVWFLQSTGIIKKAVFDYRTDIAPAAGILVMGKYQISRGSRICSQELELELLDSVDAIASVKVLTSYQGTVFDGNLQLTQFENTGNYRRYQGMIEGKNLTYVIQGAFSLAGMTLTATKGAQA